MATNFFGGAYDLRLLASFGMPHLFVDISAHGFGHLAQTAPVLETLTAQIPELRLTIRSGLPAAYLRLRIPHPFTHVAAASDLCFLMHDAVRIDHEASAAAYRAFHADWPARVAAEAAMLSSLAPDLVFANVSALPLAGARQAGIPALALCSLNWADQFAFLFGKEDWARAIHAELQDAYANADAFLRCTPAAPMPTLSNAIAVPPVARIGHADRAALAARIGALDERIVLIGMGGIDFDLPVAAWPRVEGVRWLVRDPLPVPRSDVACYGDLDWHFSDLLASVDAVVTKPGYGMFVESAAAGVPLLYLRRDDWPEQEALIGWLQAEAVCAELSVAQFAAGDLQAVLQELWARPRKTAVANGAGVVAGRLAALLRAGSRSA